MDAKGVYLAMHALLSLSVGIAFGSFQSLKQGLEPFVALLFRVHVKVANGSADMQIVVAQGRFVPGELGH
ncbi:hypothetical protein QN219_00765 [Sinorhizobium sp. 7-81]|uniref:hypothetical protein n=1 Tax=Sinorhizobium sp. 8-89 TaxID=3049089 RepID=UPI0024C37A16|nr:hypothetical protein [Sinorhizobium sp. 8-89]MDK1488598.1 hypothetical protein [Sinorhizobium sp. 8-89]